MPKQRRPKHKPQKVPSKSQSFHRTHSAVQSRSAVGQTSVKGPKTHYQPSQKANPRPWSKVADLLLVGEGDFSFAHALYTKHHSSFRSLTATCYDSRDQLLEKYAQAEKHITELESLVNTGPDEDTSDSQSGDEFDHGEFYGSGIDGTLVKKEPPKVLYGIDARKLSSHKPLKNRTFDYIIFNFPHTGGLSTDVNRQVRANQSLLVDFFTSSKPLLKASSSRDGNEAGKVMITLFEQEPYTLWNVRDLGRHCGYAVERSWRFDWGAWEGYAHARTVGDLRKKAEREPKSDKGNAPAAGEVHKVAGDGELEKEEEWQGFSDSAQDTEAGMEEMPSDTDLAPQNRPGRWHGEERQARTYLFSLKSEDKYTQGGKKRKRHEDSDDDD